MTLAEKGFVEGRRASAFLSLFCPDSVPGDCRNCPFVPGLPFCPKDSVPAFFRVLRGFATASPASDACMSSSLVPVVVIIVPVRADL